MITKSLLTPEESKLFARIRRLETDNAELVEAVVGLLMEWDNLTRYGSPMAKAANERVKRARAALANRTRRGA